MTSPIPKLVALSVLVSALVVAGCATPVPAEPVVEGPWRAWLDSPGGALPFGLEIGRDGDELRAVVINGSERIPIPAVELDRRAVRFSIDHYDSAITATLSADGARMDGEWRKTAGAENESRLPFHATAGARHRFPGERAGEANRVEGRWSVRFESSEDPAVAIFESQADGTVTGTFLTTTGDYRYLAGVFRDGRLLLSCFDGAHAFLFDARLQADGSLAGDFWSRDSWHETWTARRDPRAVLPDAFAQTRWVEGARPGDAVFPDLQGNPRSLDDPEFAGKARILVVFGSWCPNCGDSTDHMVQLHRRYRDRGLSIVGLAFEMTGSFERDAAQVKRYAEYKGIEYPLLVAGLSDKDRASASFPLIDRVRSYPTTIFLHGDGRVRAVHQGYSGPATGRAHDHLRAQFESIIEELLAEPA